jgi:AraC family transcriptional regulator
MTEPTKVEPIRFEDGGELHIAGLTQHYDMKDVGQIPAQWERFRPHIGHVPGQVGSTTYGVNLRLSERVEDGFDYVTGVEVRGSEAYPAGWARLTLPPHRYAVFAHRGHISTFASTIDGIFNGWLPSSGFRLQPGGKGTLTMLERYANFDVERGTGDIEVWVPVEKG